MDIVRRWRERRSEESERRTRSEAITDKSDIKAGAVAGVQHGETERQNGGNKKKEADWSEEKSRGGGGGGGEQKERRIC